jgi:hypothetical protein
MNPQNLAPEIVPVENAALHYIDWPPILAGAFVASAIATVLFTFGAAIGLSIVSPYAGEGAPKAISFVLMGFWSLCVVVLSFWAGGYLAGRLRKRAARDASPTEVEVRDGAHGLTVWALGVVFASLLLALGVSGVMGSAARIAGAAAVSADRSHADVTQFTIDTLFRPATGVTSRRTEPLNDGERQQVARLLVYGVSKGELVPEDKTYLAGLVAQHAGMSREDAEQRVNDVIAKTKHAANAARKAAVVIAFLTAAALVVGAAMAVWAAATGGRHRDRETGADRFWNWKRVAL